jgi:TetR/AcrR family transcriptional repressor of nem operon
MDTISMNKGDVREALLAEGRRRVQANGYSALSFRELAAAVGVKSSSVHYYWPTKGDLAAELASRYTSEGEIYLDGLLETFEDERTLFDSYVKVFRAALEQDNRMCLCGMLAAERDELPPAVVDEVNAFIDVNVRWLVKALTRATGAKATKTVSQRAIAIFAAIEGAQLVARSRGEIRVFDETVQAYRGVGLFP